MIARKIHRWLVLAILITGIVMSITGLSLYSGQASMIIRALHHQLSIIFALVLGLMGLTGSYLFIFPYLR